MAVEFSRRSDSLPVYLQVAEMLVREVASGRIGDGEKLRPERGMAADLGIAVGTLRKALAELQRRGLLVRVQGSGNYIRLDPVRGDTGSVYGLFRLELIDGGGLPSADVLSVDRTTKPRELPAFGPSPDAHRIRRLRRLSGRPAAIEEIWLDASHAQDLRPGQLSESLYRFYAARLGLRIVRAEDRIGLGEVPDWAPPDFGLRPGATVPLVERIAESDVGERAEVSRTWYDPGVARYVVRLKQEVST